MSNEVRNFGPFFLPDLLQLSQTVGRLVWMAPFISTHIISTGLGSWLWLGQLEKMDFVSQKVFCSRFTDALPAASPSFFQASACRNPFSCWIPWINRYFSPPQWQRSTSSKATANHDTHFTTVHCWCLMWCCYTDDFIWHRKKNTASLAVESQSVIEKFIFTAFFN